MSGRYEIEDTCPGVIGVKLGTNTWYLDDEQPEAQAIRQLQQDLAAVTAENAALLVANRDCKDHFDALKGDYDEAAHFARHFIRDDSEITPRGAIIRLGDKCTDLFVRLQRAESRLAEIEKARPKVQK